MSKMNELLEFFLVQGGGIGSEINFMKTNH